MRILHVLASNRFAGAERVAVNIIRHMPEHECVYISPSGPIEAQLKNLGVQYHPLDKLTPGNMRKIVHYYQPDIIHAHDYKASVINASSWETGKVISHLHCNYPWANRVNPKTCLYRLTIPKYKRIITVSEAIRDDFIFSSIRKHATVLYNVIDLQKILSSSREITVRDTDLLFMGRLTEQKDPLAFISLVSELSKLNPNITAVMLGEGELEKNCRHEIERLKLNRNIELLGFKTNPFPYIAAARLLVMTSKWEGFALTAMEALALGKPVVAYNTGGFKEIIKDGETGCLCAGFADMAGKVNELLEDRDLLQQMGRQAQQWAAEKNNMEKYISSLKEIYGSH